MHILPSTQSKISVNAKLPVTAIPTSIGVMHRLLTQQDVLNYFQVTRQTIYIWRRKGIFPKPLKVGSFLRWRREDIEAFANQHLAHI